MALATLGAGLILGADYPLALLVGPAAYALGWIYVPDFKIFRNWVDRRRHAQQLAVAQSEAAGFVQRRDALLEQLSPQGRAKYQALAAVCRHPDVFRLGVCMSGTYDFSRWMGGAHTVDYHYASPMHFLPTMPEGRQLQKLRTRFLILATGTGDYESPWESWAVGQILGDKRVPNRVDFWKDYRHDWMTWREMLPKYLAEHA